MTGRGLVPIAVTALLVLVGQPGNAYYFLGQRWNDGAVVMHLQQGSSSVNLIDGAANWNAVSEGALAIWNNQIGRVQFRVERNSSSPIALRNNINNVLWDDDVYGESFGEAVAVAYSMWIGTRKTEADVIFNNTLRWDSYRGNLRSSGGAWVYDLRRVAIHEFGHVLGLGHPDQNGQTVNAIMNHQVSNVDTVTSDDINGGRALYGAPEAPPPPPTDRLEPDTRMALNSSLTSPNGTYRLVYQSDGNLVLYTGSSPVWSTNTGASNASPAVLQGDGNFVIYNAAGIARWATNTAGQGRARLVLQNDGNLVLYRVSDNQPIWDRSRSVPPFPLPTSNTVSETLTGTLSASSAACSGSGSGNSSCLRHAFSVGASGTIEGRLAWSGDNDLDLELWRGSTKVASSDGVTTTETVSTSVTAGSYEWRVVYYSGSSSQSYSLAVTRPN